jgi:hypothetical protein
MARQAKHETNWANPTNHRTLLYPLSLYLLVFIENSSSALQAWSQQSLTPAQEAVATAELPDAPLPPSQNPISIPALPITQPPADSSGQASVHGIVTGEDGSVYQGVHVTLSPDFPSASAMKTAVTDSNGSFQFTNVAPGAFQLTFSSEGFATHVVPGLLHPGENFETPAIVLSFATATTEVRVTASQVEIAEEQMKDEEKQRVFGAIPNFYVVYAPNAAPLDTKQKFHLAWKSSIDPMTFLITGGIAGYEQAANSFSGYGQGAQGYGKRYAANYADNFIGTMIGGAILPSILKQDPRYFYKGTGTIRSRILYAIATSVVCKSDSGRWQPNYSGILGSLAAGGISNLYYPASNREGVTLTFQEAGLGILGGAAQNLFQEFLVRRLTPKVPTYQSTTQSATH